MRTELKSIPTDSVPLDGVMYTPDTESINGAALYFHGNTMNFYNSREAHVAGIVADWLVKTLGLPRRQGSD